MMPGTTPHFVLFSLLSLNQQKVLSSNQLVEYEIFSVQIETRKRLFLFFLFVLAWNPTSSKHITL